MKITLEMFPAACEAHGLPRPVAEFIFNDRRKWRFDFCWIEQNVALEVEGGVWTQGRHNRATGFIADMEKYNEAAIAKWRVLRCLPQDVESGKVFALLGRALGHVSATQ